MATGVLPVFCGGASKAVDLQLNHNKSYRAVLKLGARTDTGDVTGTVLETAPVTAGEGELLAVLPQFIGPQMQVPPMYSAIKLNGQPLYKLAREGVTVERKARPIEIYSITYGGSPAENEYVLDVTCSKGTYIRTLLEDIAAAMGQKGTMSALRRTSAGVYTEADAHTLEEILAAKEQGMDALEALMLPVESVFTPLPLLVVEPWVEQHLYNGCPTSRYPQRMAATGCAMPPGSSWGWPTSPGACSGWKNCSWTELTEKRNQYPCRSFHSSSRCRWQTPHRARRGHGLLRRHPHRPPGRHRRCGAVGQSPRGCPGGVYLPAAGGQQNEGQAPAVLGGQARADRQPGRGVLPHAGL